MNFDDDNKRANENEIDNSIGQTATVTAVTTTNSRWHAHTNTHISREKEKKWNTRKPWLWFAVIGGSYIYIYEKWLLACHTNQIEEREKLCEELPGIKWNKHTHLNNNNKKKQNKWKKKQIYMNSKNRYANEYNSTNSTKKNKQI